jgi:hypothetical protein
MFDPSDPNLFWLNVTNVVLGLVVLSCCVVLGYGVVREVAARVRVPKLRFLEVDDHAFSTPDLGITMADGGHRIDQKSATLVTEQGELRSNAALSDESHIIRGEN